MEAFVAGGATPDAAEQSRLVYVSAVVAWIALDDRPRATGPEARFEQFVEALLRGLPVTG